MYRDKVFLIIGAGSIGERHARNLLSKGAGRIIMARGDPRKSLRTLDASMVEVISEEQIASFPADYAIICSPSSMHAGHLRMMFERGVPCLIEVPLVSDHTQLHGLRERFPTEWQRSCVAHNIVFHPVVKRVQEIIEASLYGRCLYVRQVFGEFLPALHRWEDYRTRYEARKDLGGGALLTSIHEPDLAVRFLGPIEQAKVTKENLRLGTDAEDFVTATMHHVGGGISITCLDFISPVYTRETVLHFEDAVLMFQLPNSRLVTKQNINGLVKVTQEERLNYDFNETYVEEMDYFVGGDFSMHNKLSLDSSVELIQSLIH